MQMDKNMPLAARMRPDTLEEFVGQQHIIGKNKLLYRAIKSDRLSSVIFYGLRGPERPPWPHHIPETKYPFKN